MLIHVASHSMTRTSNDSTQHDSPKRTHITTQHNSNNKARLCKYRMTNQNNDNNTEQQEEDMMQNRTCTYCNKKLNKRWNHRANGAAHETDWMTRAMHGTCWKKDREAAIANINMQHWMKQQAEAKLKHMLEQPFIDKDARPNNDMPSTNPRYNTAINNQST